MAKNKDTPPVTTVEFQGLEKLEANPPAVTGIVQPVVSPEQDDPRDEQIAALKRRIAMLEKEKTTPAPTQSVPGVYRVSLGGLRPKNPTVTIEPRTRLGGTALTRFLGEQPQSYKGLELFLETRSADLQGAAWERFRKARDFKAEDRKEFRIRVEGGPALDYLDIPAPSHYEAEALFRQFNGITVTTSTFETQLVRQAG